MGFLIGIIAEMIRSPVLDRWLDNAFVIEPLCALLLVPSEIALLSLFGTTLGKKLYAIRIEGEAGGKPTLRQAVSRMLSVWFRGMALGIPLVSLLTFYLGYKTLTEDGAVPWDEVAKTNVRHGAIGKGRIIALAIMWVIVGGLVLFGLYGTVMGL